MTLTKKQRDLLDGYVTDYLAREPAPLHSVFAHLELHSTDEIWSSMTRLKKAGRIAEVHHQRKGSCWALLRNP